jgi:DNA-binding GntR family transcriptional regulator
MNRPVHISIRDDLRARITAGEWCDGHRLPSEADLASLYGVARMTVRQAIGSLASEGLLIRRQGLGTFVSEDGPTRQAGLLRSFSEEMQELGRDVRTTLVSATVTQPPPDARDALHLGQGAAAIMVRRLRSLDGRPVVVQASWLPYARFTGLDAEPLLDGSLYAMLEGPYGVQVARARQAYSIALVDESDAALLGLMVRDPVLRTVRTTYDRSGLAIEYAISSMRAGYPVEMILDRRVAAVRPRAENIALRRSSDATPSMAGRPAATVASDVSPARTPGEKPTWRTGVSRSRD